MLLANAMSLRNNDLDTSNEKCTHVFHSFKLLFSFGHLFGNKHQLDPEESWSKQAIIEARWAVNTQSYMRNESTIQNGN